MPLPLDRPPAAAPPRPALAVVHAGVTYRVAVKRVGSARRFTLRVRAATRDAVLTMPPRASLRTARAFAERHAAWLVTRLDGLPSGIALAPGTVVPLRGVDHVIAYAPGRGGAAIVEVEVANPASMPRLVCRAGDPASVPGAVLEFLHREAKRDFARRVAHHAAAVGKAVRRVTLRDTRSRWGSCSSRGTLNFSWRLVLAPPLVLDYLVAHEVAHLVHLDHSPAFWTLCRGLAPHTETAERWLKLNGAALHRYGAA